MIEITTGRPASTSAMFVRAHHSERLRAEQPERLCERSGQPYRLPERQR